MSKRLLLVAVIAGLAVRLVVLAITASTPAVIADEQQYVHLATSLDDGDGFAWGPGQPTSLRPPLYPFLVAAIWKITGPSLPAVRVVQVILAALTSLVVFVIGRRVFSPDVGRLAAVFVWLYPSLIYANSTILTETLFTLLLATFVLLTVILGQTGRMWTAAACGVVLGLAALTRSVVWPLPLVLCPLLVLVLPGALRVRAAAAALVLLGYVACVAPWAVRNTRLQHVPTVVDTMGGMNLRMGNYEYTPDDRMWDAVGLTGTQSWVYGIDRDFSAPPTEGQKDKWAQHKALVYMREHPWTTLRRSLIKFADLWGIEREFIAGVAQGLYHPPPWLAGPVALLIAGAYIAMALLGALGLWLAAPGWRTQTLLLLPLLAVTAAHTIVFGHSRYHLPLVPILALYAAAFLQRPRALRLRRDPAAWGAAATVGVLALIWLRELILVDAERIRHALRLIL